MATYRVQEVTVLSGEFSMASVLLTFISCTVPAKLRHRKLLPTGNCKNGAMTHAAAFPTPVVLWSKPEEERAGQAAPGPPARLRRQRRGSPEPGGHAAAGIRGGLGACSDGFRAGFTWFPLTASIDYSLDAVKDAASYVEDWLDAVRPDHPSVTLLGFSMGMALATTLLRRRPADYAAVVGLSGFAVDAAGDPSFRDADLDGTVPMFWGRDQQDPVITPDKVEFTMGLGAQARAAHQSALRRDVARHQPAGNRARLRVPHPWGAEQVASRRRAAFRPVSRAGARLRRGC